MSSLPSGHFRHVSLRSLTLQQLLLRTSRPGAGSLSLQITEGGRYRATDETSSCFPFSLSDKAFVVVFLVFLGCVLFSSATNGFLLFLMMRYKRLLWQPQYILTKYISVCGVGMTSVTALVVLSSVARGQSRTYGRRCVAQFCILRCFFLTSQMTLALMAAERYVFILSRHSLPENDQNPQRSLEHGAGLADQRGSERARRPGVDPVRVWLPPANERSAVRPTPSPSRSTFRFHGRKAFSSLVPRRS